MLIGSRLLRFSQLRRHFSTEHIAESSSESSHKANTTPRNSSLEAVERFANNQYNFLKFSSIFRQCEIQHSLGVSIHRQLPPNEQRKLDAIQQYIDTLTEQQIKYLKYVLADDASRKKHNKVYPDDKREYYYELGFFGRTRAENVEKIELAGREEAMNAIK